MATDEKSRLVSSTGKGYGSVKYQRLEDDDEQRSDETNFGLVVLIVSVIGVAGIAAGLGVGLPPLLAKLNATQHPPDVRRPLPPSPLTFEGHYSRAAVSSDAEVCSEIGRDVLSSSPDATAADASIAVLFCLGVVLPNYAGMGGGFFATVYRPSDGTAAVVNARETAPEYSDQDTPVRITGQEGLIVAVPGELRGYEELHRRFGKLPWSQLVQPAIKLCEEGTPIHPALLHAVQNNLHAIRADPGLSSIYLNSTTNEPVVEGTILKRPDLAKTLKIIALEGPSAFYNGSLTQDFLMDVQERGGILTFDDLMNYNISYEEALSVPYHIPETSENLTMFTVRPPGSGSILAFILNIMEGYGYTPDSLADVRDEVTFRHLFAEAFKFGYGARTDLGDQRYVADAAQQVAEMMSKEYAAAIRSMIDVLHTSGDNPGYYGADYQQTRDYGTTHMSLVAPNGDAIAVTSTINSNFGAGFLSRRTGIVPNDEMLDFARPNSTDRWGLPSSESNFAEPGKRPMSSMCPTIFVNENGSVRLAIGASGGSRITTSVAYVTARHLWLRDGIKDAIDAPRFHHQLTPNVLQYEYGVLDQHVSGLRHRGHQMGRDSVGRVTAVAHFGNETDAPQKIWHASADFRKNGGVAGF